MPSGKANFNRGTAELKIKNWDLPDEVKERLKSILIEAVEREKRREQKSEGLCGKDHRAGDDQKRSKQERDEQDHFLWWSNYEKIVDQFVNQIGVEARSTRYEVAIISSRVTRADMLAELTSLRKRTQSLRDNFRNLSPDVDHLFFDTTEPKAHADYLEVVCNELDTIIDRAQNASQKARTDTEYRLTAIEFAIRVLGIAKNFRIKTTATYHPTDYWISDAVILLDCLGKSVGLDYSPSTWRDIIGEAKKQSISLMPPVTKK